MGPGKFILALIVLIAVLVIMGNAISGAEKSSFTPPVDLTQRDLASAGPAGTAAPRCMNNVSNYQSDSMTNRSLHRSAARQHATTQQKNNFVNSRRMSFTNGQNAYAELVSAN